MFNEERTIFKLFEPKKNTSESSLLEYLLNFNKTNSFSIGLFQDQFASLLDDLSRRRTRSEYKKPPSFP